MRAHPHHHFGARRRHEPRQADPVWCVGLWGTSVGAAGTRATLHVRPQQQLITRVVRRRAAPAEHAAAQAEPLRWRAPLPRTQMAHPRAHQDQQQVGSMQLWRAQGVQQRIASAGGAGSGWRGPLIAARCCLVLLQAFGWPEPPTMCTCLTCARARGARSARRASRPRRAPPTLQQLSAPWWWCRWVRRVCSLAATAVRLSGPAATG
jgi:hypothetical protein